MQDVEVLGTEFNISAYEGIDVIQSTLVEGKVLISNGVLSKELLPGLQSQFSIKNEDINISKVDVFNEIAWKNGFFNFEKEALDTMLKTLGRWYDVEVVFEKNDLRNLMFSGVLKRTNNIEELLENIEKTGKVNFEISEKIITVK